jgi:hypothetical protein
MDADKYPITASNHTYIFLDSMLSISKSFGIRSAGISIPHSRSLVMAVGFNPLSNHCPVSD